MSGAAEAQVRTVLEAWAEATRLGRLDDVLANHAPEARIFDVLPPLSHDGAEAYRRTWDDWQPETQGEAVFHLEGLSITAGEDVAFAHGFLCCGGTLADGRTFRDRVRATFCLARQQGAWRVLHQHISKPVRA